MSPPDGTSEVRQIIGMAEEVRPEPPRPLMRELSSADPFPLDALGDVLGASRRPASARASATNKPYGRSRNARRPWTRPRV
jgi:hypothetical protein